MRNLIRALDTHYRCLNSQRVGAGAMACQMYLCKHGVAGGMLKRHFVFIE